MQSYWRHKKTGGIYDVIAHGQMQTDNWEQSSGPLCVSVDMAPVVVYRSTADGRVWVRPVEEFEQRFEQL